MPGFTLAAMSHGLPQLISLDTSTERVHVALLARGQTLVRVLSGGAQASVTLLPAMQELMSDAGLTWAQLDAIAFGAGPGAFTGLRTACSTAQGLALGVSKPVIPLDTLMLVAEDARLSAPDAWAEGDEVWVLQDARMDELYAGAFVWRDQQWHVTQSAQLWPLDEPRRRWTQQAPKHLTGSGLNAYPDQFDGLHVSHSWPTAMPSGAAQASLASRAWQRGESVDAALALPRYVRDKVAQTTAERMAAKTP